MRLTDFQILKFRGDTLRTSMNPENTAPTVFQTGRELERQKVLSSRLNNIQSPELYKSPVITIARNKHM